MRSERRTNARRGLTAPLVAVCLIVLMSVVAIALDGGLLFDQRQRVQAAADAAALAAVENLYYNWQANSGKDTGGTALAAALANASANGYNNDGATSIVTVRIPPTTGAFVGLDGYAEVIIQFNQKRGFSAIFGGGDIPVRGRAVARGLWVPFNDGIIVLHPTAPSALFANGNGTVKVQGASIIVDVGVQGDENGMHPSPSYLLVEQQVGPFTPEPKPMRIDQLLLQLIPGKRRPSLWMCDQPSSLSTMLR
jgi:hypothetical protein